MSKANKTNKAVIIATLLLLAGAVAGFMLLDRPDTAQANWYDDSWLYRKTLTIDPAQVAGDLTDFPVLVSFTDSDVSTSAQETGDDIIFIDSSGEKLAHEIESYASSTGTLVAWVKVPRLSSTEQTQIYMYYGNAGVGSQEQAEKVWDDGYVGVWHLPDDVNASTTDSTRNNNNGYVYNNASSTASSKVAGGFNFGTDDYIDIPYDSSLDIYEDMTLQAWIKPMSTTTGYMDIISKGNLGGGSNYYLETINDRLVCGWNGGGEYQTASGSIAADNWYYVNVAYDYSSQTLNHYIDGSLSTSTEGLSTPPGNGVDYNEAVRIGLLWATEDFHGIIDEVRISKIARSAAWIETEYNNQNDPASFFSVSAQEQGKGPVGYWSFDEGYGTTANDNSGQGNNGTITGAAWTDESQCVSGKCLYFDGVDGTHVEINPYNNLESGTACFWLKANSLTNEDSDTSIVLLDGDIFLRFDNSGNLRMFVSTSGVYPNVYGTAESNIEINSWYYVCGVYNGIGVNPKLFINGKDASTLETAGTGTDNVQSSYDIGQNSGTEGQFHGFLDEVKIYPYARSADEIKADYNAGLSGMQSNTGVAASFGGASDKWMSDGLVGYWKFDESATTSGAVDSSGNGNNGTYEGNASTTAGKFGNGGVFDGDGDYADAGNSTSLNNLTTFSLSWWMKPDNRDNNDWIIGKHTNGQSGTEWFVDISDVSDSELSLVKDVSGGSGSESAEWDDAVFSDEWQHIIIVVPDILDSPNWSLYRNGELVAKTAYTENSGGTYGDDSAHNFQIGSNGFYDFDGQIDEVRIYNRALSRDEVAALHEWAPGPVAWWKFDEGEGETTTGISYNGDNHTTTLYPGTSGSNIATSSMWHSTGKFGKAIEFDGTDDYLWQYSSRLGDPYVFTYEAWIYPRSFGENDQGGIMGATISSHIPRSEVRLHNDDAPLGSIRADVDCNGTNAESEAVAGSIELDKWQHVAVTFNYSIDGYIRIFVDGVEVEYDSQIEAGGEPNANNFFIIGETYDYQRTFDGYIDDVRVYDYVRTQKQILDDMSGFSPETNNSQALKQSVLHLKFDEGKGAVAYDSSIHANNGTLYPGTGGANTASSAMWSLDGHSKGAMEFDGVDDYVDLGDIDALDTLGEITASAWVNWKESTGVREYVLAKSASGFYSWQLLIENAPGRFAWTTNTGAGPVESNTDYIPDNNRWYHLVGVYDGSSQYLYVDGDLVDSDAQTGAMSDYSSSLLVGAEPDTPYEDFFHGLIDEVQIWNYALTAEEVKTVYNDTKGAVWGSTGQSASTATSSNAKSLEYCVPGSSDYCAAPVLELKFDEYGGTTAYDTSGNGNDGTLTWMSTSTRGGWVATGKKGSALSFDGVDDYVDVDNFAPTGADPRTISFWFNADTFPTGAEHCMVCYDYGGDAGRDFDILAEDNAVAIDFYNHEVITPKSTLNTDEWYFVSAVVPDSSTLTSDVLVYINGVLQPLSDELGSAQTLNTIRDDIEIGNRGPSSQMFYSGLIDDVRIYDYARTPAQIAWDYNGGGPVAHWAFNECKGSTIYDSSVHANHGTLNLGTSGTTATGTCAESASSFWYNGRSGAKNAGGYFDGTDDYIDVGDTGINVNSVAFWFKQDYTDADIIDLDGGTHTVTLADSKVTATGFSSPTIYVNGQPATAIPNSGWHHVLVTTATTIDASNLDIARIGTDYFTGQLDEVKLWTYPLTATQTKTEYAGGAISFGSRPSQSGEALASSWTCGDSVYNDNDSITYATILADDGNCWLASNLGTANIATAYNDSSAYGAYYQWGRLADGHQISTSGTTGTNSSGDVPGHDDFITESSSPYDWRVPQNDNLWQGVDGTNNPCPAGWRIPTQTEWATLVSDEVITDYTTAFSSSLKLTAAGYRDSSDGSLLLQGSRGHYWSSSPNGAGAYYLFFNSSGVDPALNTYRAHGFSARCLKN